MNAPSRSACATALVWIFAQASPGAPANDDFAERALLSGALPISATADTTDATLEAADPVSYGSQGLTVWYEWTATADGLYAVKIEPTAPDPRNSWRFGVTHVGGGENRTPIAQKVYYGSFGRAEFVYFRALAGSAYQFVLGSKLPGEFDITLRDTAPAIPGVIDLGNATPVGIERGQGFAGTGLEWSWTAPQDGLYVLDYYPGLLLTGIQPQFDVTGADGNPTDPLFPTWWAEHASGTGYHYFRANAGTAYRISSFDEEARFVLDRLPDAPHAELALAADLGSPPTFTVRGHLAQAKPEALGAAAPPPVSLSIGSQWWKWRAPAAGNYRINSFPVRVEELGDFWYPPQVWVFSGQTAETLQPVPTSPNWWNNGLENPEGHTFIFHAGSAGDEFRIGLLNVIEGTGPYRPGLWEIELQPEPAAPNDDFQNAITLFADGGGPVEWQGYFATLQDGEPAPSALQPQPEPWQIVAQPSVGSLWWTWLATDGTPVEVRSFGGTVDFYTGDSLASLQAVESIADSGVSYHRAFVPSAGQRYYLQIGGVLSTGQVEILPRPGLAAPPANDHWANAESITLAAGQASAQYTVSNATATAEPGEPAHVLWPMPRPASRSRWWKWTADREALVYILFRSGAVAVYTGATLDALQPEISWGDYALGTGSSEFLLRSEIGKTYYIALDDDIESLNEGHFSFIARVPIPPANDDFGQRTELLRREVVVGQSTRDIVHNTYSTQATIDDGTEPAPSQAGARQTTWFSWTCDTADSVAIQLHTPRLPDRTPLFSIDVYRGSTLASLQRVETAGHATPDSAPWTIFSGTPGTQYSIAVTSLPHGSTATIDMGNAPPGTLAREAWLQRYPELTFAQTAENAAPAGDGIPNIVKRALGLSPLIKAYSGLDPNSDHAPYLERLPDGQIRLVYTLDPAESSLVVKGQASPTGSGFWSTVEPVSLGGDRYALYLQPGHRQFLLRLWVYQS